MNTHVKKGGPQGVWIFAVTKEGTVLFCEQARIGFHVRSGGKRENKRKTGRVSVPKQGGSTTNSARPYVLLADIDHAIRVQSDKRLHHRERGGTNAGEWCPKGEGCFSDSHTGHRSRGAAGRPREGMMSWGQKGEAAKEKRETLTEERRARDDSGFERGQGTDPVERFAMPGAGVNLEVAGKAGAQDGCGGKGDSDREIVIDGAGALQNFAQVLGWDSSRTGKRHHFQRGLLHSLGGTTSTPPQDTCGRFHRARGKLGAYELTCGEKKGKKLRPREVPARGSSFFNTLGHRSSEMLGGKWARGGIVSDTGEGPGLFWGKEETNHDLRPRELWVPAVKE